MSTDGLTTAIEVIVIAVGAAIGILWTVRTGFFTLQKRTVESYKEALDSAAANNTELMQRVSVLESKVHDFGRKLRAMEAENEKLRATVVSKEGAIAEMLAAVAVAGVCGRVECADRIPPQGMVGP